MYYFNNSIIFSSYTPYNDNIVGGGLLLKKAVAQRDYRRVFGILWCHPYLINVPDAQGRTLIHEAVSNGDEEMVALLIRLGADINKEDELGEQPLSLASRSLCPAKVVDVLLSNGADVTSRDPSGVTALHWASIMGNVRVCQQLLRAKADVNAPDNNGRSPSYLAVYFGQLATARLLLGAKGDVNEEDRRGCSVLHQAVKCGCVALVAQVVSRGVSDFGSAVPDFNLSGRLPLLLTAARISYAVNNHMSSPEAAFKQLGSVAKVAVIKNLVLRGYMADVRKMLYQDYCCRDSSNLAVFSARYRLLGRVMTGKVLKSYDKDLIGFRLINKRVMALLTVSEQTNKWIPVISEQGVQEERRLDVFSAMPRAVLLSIFSFLKPEVVCAQRVSDIHKSGSSLDGEQKVSLCPGEGAMLSRRT